MKKIFNILFYVLKFILLIAAFGLTLFIIIRMDIRLEKSVMSSFESFIPFIVIFILFMVNMIFRQVGVTKNLFYNLTCCLVLSTIVLVSLRAVLDTNMVLNGKYGYGIDFNFFDNFLAYINIMLYGLSVANIFFMFREKDVKENKVEKKVDKKEIKHKKVSKA